MCGIVGVAGNLTAKTDKIFKNLLILDTLRGIDSTGIAAVDRTDEVRVVKQVGNPFDLFGYKSFDTAINRMNRAIIGHNRYATTGAVTRKNAHPFEFDNIIGVHNGTLQNRHKLLDSAMFNVDSENLYWHLQERGLDDLLTVLDGAWSLVWWNKEEETLNFLRNKERPMWITSSNNGEVIAWASEPWMLDVACGREDIKFEEPVSTQTDHLYTFNIKKNAVIEKPHVREAKSSVPPIQVYGNFQRGQRGCAGNFSVQQPQTTSANITTAEVIALSTGLDRAKNSRVTPVTVSPKRTFPSSTNLYAGRKDVLLEVLAEAKDKHGSKYLACFDPENRSSVIRLYLKRDQESKQLIQKEILCTIGNKVAASDGIYYKVEHGSVKLAPEYVNKEESSDNESDDSNGKYFMDSRGKLTPVLEWMRKYSSCSFCTGWVDPKKDNRFSEQGDIVCNECVNDSEVHKYVKLN